VAAECAGGVIHGVLREMAFDGLLLDVGGETRFLAPETVRHLRPVLSDGSMTEEHREGE
jgi:hypothetical protein